MAIEVPSHRIPLKCSVVEHPRRLSDIISELSIWAVEARHRKETPELLNYLDIIKRLIHGVIMKRDFIEEPFRKIIEDDRIVAAYDKDGNLQGVAYIVLEESVKVQLLVTAIWNRDKDPKRAAYTRGACTCLMMRIAMIAKKRDISLQSRADALPFYQKLEFVQGQGNSIILPSRLFSDLENKTKDQLQACEESDLPETHIHLETLKEFGIDIS